MLFLYVIQCLIKIEKEIKKYDKHKNNRLLLKFIVAKDFSLGEYLGKDIKFFFNNLTFEFFKEIT